MLFIMKPIHHFGSLLLLLLGSATPMKAQQVTISPGLYVTATGAPNLVLPQPGPYQQWLFLKQPPVPSPLPTASTYQACTDQR